MTPTYAVLPSLGRECLAGAVDSLLDQVDLIFLVRTEEYSIPVTRDPAKVIVIDDQTRPRNIQRWWNLGLTAAAARARMLHQEQWNVLVVNDDIVACPQLTAILGPAMRTTTAVLAYPDNTPPGNRWVLHTAPGAVDTTTRISGWCFMIRGESGLRADEQFQWWYGDDDIDWRARSEGGALMVPGCAVVHLYPGGTTNASPELTARTQLDRMLFMAKWAGTPH
jgi:hypothetical protein